MIDVIVKIDKEGQEVVEGEWDTEEATPEGTADGRLIDITGMSDRCTLLPGDRIVV